MDERSLKLNWKWGNKEQLGFAWEFLWNYVFRYISLPATPKLGILAPPFPLCQLLHFLVNTWEKEAMFVMILCHYAHSSTVSSYLWLSLVLPFMWHSAVPFRGRGYYQFILFLGWSAWENFFFIDQQCVRNVPSAMRYHKFFLPKSLAWMS